MFDLIATVLAWFYSLVPNYAVAIANQVLPPAGVGIAAYYIMIRYPRAGRGRQQHRQHR